jgi:hypothetical protein
MAAYLDHCYISYVGQTGSGNSSWPSPATNGTTVDNKSTLGTPANYDGTVTSTGDRYHVLQSNATSLQWAATTEYVHIPAGSIVNSPLIFTVEILVYIGDTGVSFSLFDFDASKLILYYQASQGRIFLQRISSTGVYRQYYTPVGCMDSEGWYSIQVAWDATPPGGSNYEDPPEIRINNVTQPLTRSGGVVATWATVTAGITLCNTTAHDHNAPDTILALFRWHTTLLTDAQLSQNYDAELWRYKYTVSADPDAYEAWPNIVRLHDGVLVCTYRTADTNTHTWDATGRIVCRRSTDGGATWGDEITIYNPSGDTEACGCGSVAYTEVLSIMDPGQPPSEFTLDNIFACIQTRNQALDYSILGFYSTNGGLSWVGPTTIVPLYTHADSRCRTVVAPAPIRLSNGWLGFALANNTFTHLYWEYSTDGGGSWHEVSIGTSNDSPTETAQVETMTNGVYTGGILAISRYETSAGASLLKWRSSDYGRTWRADGMITGLCTGGTASKVAVCRIRLDTLLLTIADGTATGMYMLFSLDEGETWKPSDCPGYRWGSWAYRGYPDTTLLDVDNVITAWCTNSTASDVYVTPHTIASMNIPQETKVTETSSLVYIKQINITVVV